MMSIQRVDRIVVMELSGSDGDVISKDRTLGSGVSLSDRLCRLLM